MRNRYFVCYDVSDPQRLARTYKKMNGYGDPVQYSVFLCELNAKELIIMRSDLEEILNLGEDRVLIINVGPATEKNYKQITTIGAQIKSQREDVVVV